MANTAAQGFSEAINAQLEPDFQRFMEDATTVERALLRDILTLWHANHHGEGEDGFTLAWAIDEVCGTAVAQPIPAA